MGAVAFLLLITCANLANLALARASTRQGEFAVRRAFGAGGGRIVRQLLTQSVLLALVSGAVGLGLGKLLLAAIVVAERTSLPRVEEVGLNPTAIAFALAVSLVAGIAVGIIPSMRVSTSNSMDVLRQGLRASGTNQRARSVLVVAFAIVALITAALGVFGVLSFVVAQRTRELGIRMALGAAPGDVRRLVIRHGGTLAVALTFGAVSAILLGIGVFASWLPAHRATRIDPIVALRSD
jgi:ABC-type antimicrobial peptide transport system permease subunit